MSGFAALVKYTFIENVRQKVYYVLALFGIVLLAASGILSSIGGEQKIRVLRDLGRFAAEYTALFTALLIGATFIYDEIENKSVYMIVSRPVSAAAYLAGRYFGFLLSICALLFFMTIINLALPLLAGAALERSDFAAPLLSALKVGVILSVSVFFAMLTTSKPASMGFAMLFWVLGHFTAELEFLSRLAASPVVKIMSSAVGFLVPRLDKLSPLELSGVGVSWMASAFLYAAFYCAAALGAAWLIFRRKEF